MRTGKVPYNILKRSILRPIGSRRPEVLLGAGIGNDSSVLRAPEGGVFVMSTSTSALDWGYAVEYLLNRVMNDLAGCGAEAAALQVALTVSPKTEELSMAGWMKQLEQGCEKSGMQITGGHTMISEAVNQPLLSLSGIGYPKYFSAREARPDMDLILTKQIGLEGTFRLAIEKEQELIRRYTDEFLRGAKKMREYSSVVPEAAIAGQHGVTAMHNVSEGGIFGALWEMADKAGVGLEVELKDIPIRQETVEICEFLGLNPYQLISGGAMLMAAEDGADLVRQLKKAGIEASVIGKTTDKKDRVLMNRGEVRYLDRPQPDEIYRKALERGI